MSIAAIFGMSRGISYSVSYYPQGSASDDHNTCLERCDPWQKPHRKICEFRVQFSARLCCKHAGACFTRTSCLSAHLQQRALWHNK